MATGSFKGTPKGLVRQLSSASSEKDSWKKPTKIEELVETLGLESHPEGGYFRITWTSSHCSVIDYLMSAGAFSAWHRIKDTEEVWTHHGGDPVIMHRIQDGVYSKTVMGIERFSVVVPPNVWQAAEPVGDNYSLVGCICTPPFEFSNWEMPTRKELIQKFPEHADVIECLTVPHSDAGGPI